LLHNLLPQHKTIHLLLVFSPAQILHHKRLLPQLEVVRPALVAVVTTVARWRSEDEVMEMRSVKRAYGEIEIF